MSLTSFCLASRSACTLAWLFLADVKSAWELWLALTALSNAFCASVNSFCLSATCLAFCASLALAWSNAFCAFEIAWLSFVTALLAWFNLLLKSVAFVLSTSLWSLATTCACLSTLVWACAWFDLAWFKAFCAVSKLCLLSFTTLVWSVIWACVFDKASAFAWSLALAWSNAFCALEIAWLSFVMSLLAWFNLLLKSVAFVLSTSLWSLATTCACLSTLVWACAWFDLAWSNAFCAVSKLCLLSFTTLVWSVIWACVFDKASAFAWSLALAWSNAFCASEIAWVSSLIVLLVASSSFCKASGLALSKSAWALSTLALASFTSLWALSTLALASFTAWVSLLTICVWSFTLLWASLTAFCALSTFVSALAKLSS